MKKNEINEMNEVNEYFIKRKNKELSLLESKKKQYEKEIEEQQMELKSNEDILNELEYENMMLRDKYNSLKRVIKERGLIIDIINDNYNIKEWDNLDLVKENGVFVMHTKRGEKIKELDKETSVILEEIIREQGGYSLVVIRIINKHIRTIFRVKAI